MKKAIMIVGSLATLFVVGVSALAWFVANSAEYAANRNRTAAAREKRWQKKDDIGEETPFEEVKPSENGQHKKEEEQQPNNP